MEDRMGRVQSNGTDVQNLSSFYPRLTTGTSIKGSGMMKNRIILVDGLINQH